MAAGALLGDARAVFFDAVGTLLHPDPSAAEVYAGVGRRYGSRLSVSEEPNPMTPPVLYGTHAVHSGTEGAGTTGGRGGGWRRLPVLHLHRKHLNYR